MDLAFNSKVLGTKRRAGKGRKNKKSAKIGRLYYAQPTPGDKFYLRMLLNIVRGPTKYEDIRRIDDVIYPDFKSACSALSFLEDDNEWHTSLEENKQWMPLSKDILRSQRCLLRDDNLHLTDDQIKNYTLLEIEKIMNRKGKLLKKFSTIHFPNLSAEIQFGNRLLRQELDYNRESLNETFLDMYSHLNSEQKKIFNIITDTVHKKCGGFFFVYGSGGMGKIFLWNTIIVDLRSEGKIVLAVASSGIAAMLLPSGKTAHSQFRIPIDLDEFSCCDIKQQTHLAELIRKTDLIIWDEAPMLNRNIFEAVNRTFRDLMQSIDPESEQKVFGGKAVFLGGDFRQILPVIPKGKENQLLVLP